MRKVLPAPGALATVISPPISVVSMRATVSPTPLPLACAVRPRTKGSKMRSRSSSGMPGPVSRISKLATSWRNSTRKVTLPETVNFTALPSTLIRIWRSLRSSTRTTAGNSSLAW